MRKLLTVIASIALIAGVFAAQAFAHGGSRGDNDGKNWGWGHHGKRVGQVWRADLKAPTAPTEPTAAVAHYNGATSPTGQTGPTGDSNEPRGKFYFAQNGRWYAWAVKLNNLTPSTAYNVGIYVAENTTTAKKAKTSHHKKKKRASATAGALVGETVSVTTNAEGWAWAADKGPRSVFGLDKKTGYVVKVTDANGATVLQGDLLRKTHRAHRGCDGFDRSGSESRKRHHRH